MNTRKRRPLEWAVIVGVLLMAFCGILSIGSILVVLLGGNLTSRDLICNLLLSNAGLIGGAFMVLWSERIYRYVNSIIHIDAE